MTALTGFSDEGPLVDIARRGKVAWWLLLVVGILWVIIGFVVLQFDTAAIVTVAVVLFVVLLLAAIGEGFRAFATSGGWRVWHVIFAILLVIAAIAALVSPTDTVAVLGVTIGFFFVFAGVFDVITSLFNTDVRGWWLQLLGGILEILLGLLASGSVSNGVTVLLTVVGLSAVFRGIAEIGAAFTVRSALKHD